MSQPETAAASGREGVAADGLETGGAPGPDDQRDAAAGLRSESEGEEPARHVVVHPAAE